MSIDSRTLTWRHVIQPSAWRHFEGKPEELERYVHAEGRHALADEMAKLGLVRFTLNEPKRDEQNPFMEGCAVIEASVGVVVREEQSRRALELAEAEERGYQRALEAFKVAAREAAPAMASAVHAPAAVEVLIGRLDYQRAHAPDARWRPMWSLRGLDEAVEFLFADQTVANAPRKVIPRREPLRAAADPGETSATAASVDAMEAIAWRHRGRPQYQGEPQ
jgi:hypothetical protein